MAYKDYKRCATPTELTTYRRASAILRRTIKLARTESWRKKSASSLTLEPQKQKIGEPIATILGKRTQKGIPQIAVEGIENPSINDIANGL